MGCTSYKAEMPIGFQCLLDCIVGWMAVICWQCELLIGEVSGIAFMLLLIENYFTVSLLE